MCEICWSKLGHILRVASSASKRTRYIDSNDLQSSHCRPMDHDGMQVDGELDDDLHANTDYSDLPLSVSPTMPLISNERVEKNHLTDESSKRPLPSSNSQSQPTVAACISLSSLSATPDLLSIRANIQNGKEACCYKSIRPRDSMYVALRELGRSHVSNSDSPPSNELCRSLAVRNQLLLDGHRHSKLDDIVRSLSSVVSQQEVSSNRLFDARGQADRWQPTQEPVGQLLDRLNTLVDRGHSIYDRVERILDQL